MDLELQGMRALVTGGTRGIGAAIATKFKSEGCRTISVSRNPIEDHSEPTEGKSLETVPIWSIAADCLRETDLEKVRDEVVSAWGGLDILVINVGSGRGSRDILPESNEWSDVWEVNFESALRTLRVFVPILDGSRSAIVVISSIAGLEVIDAPVAYSTAKAALSVLSQNIARRIGPNCRVNVVAPGNVLVPGGVWDRRMQSNRHEMEEFLSETVPLRRLGQPSEIADLVIFLSSQRSSFITGQVVCADGGQTSGYL